jgi:hypothetical protein
LATAARVMSGKSISHLRTQCQYEVNVKRILIIMSFLKVVVYQKSQTYYTEVNPLDWRRLHMYQCPHIAVVARKCTATFTLCGKSLSGFGLALTVLGKTETLYVIK